MSTRKKDRQPETSIAAQDSVMVAAVKTYLDDMGWTYEQAERDNGERVLITTRVHVDPVVSRTVFDVAPSRQRFGLFSYVPFSVAEDKRLAVMEYLTRANYRLFLSKFEFDLSDGELRTVCMAIPEDSVLSLAMVSRMRRDVHSVLEHYLPGVLAILYGSQTAQQAWQALLDREAAKSESNEQTQLSEEERADQDAQASKE
jgi:hypothetical protein